MANVAQPADKTPDPLPPFEAEVERIAAFYAGGLPPAPCWIRKPAAA